MLARADPARAKQFGKRAQADADARWALYEQIAGVHRTISEPEDAMPAVAANLPEETKE
jgi:hypothetical protein